MPDEGAATPESPPATPPQEPEKTFKQEDVDRIVSDRLKRERDKFGDVEELRRKASKLDELEAANKSEIEKANEKVTAAEKRAEEAEARAKSTLTRAFVTSAASKAGFHDPEDAYRLIDAEDIQFDGDTPTNLDKLLKDLAKSKPHLIRTASTNGSGDGGPRGGAAAEGNDIDALIRGKARR